MFQACLKIAPGNATCLGELGWTAYLATDLALAEASTGQSLAANGSPVLRGAALYNLALIEEAKGDKPAAIAAYSQSLLAWALDGSVAITGKTKGLDEHPRQARTRVPVSL